MNRNVLLGLAGLGIGIGLLLIGGAADAAPAKPPPEPAKPPGGGGAQPPVPEPAKPPVAWKQPKQPTVAPPAGKSKGPVEPGWTPPATMPGDDSPTGKLIADLAAEGLGAPAGGHAAKTEKAKEAADAPSGTLPVGLPDAGTGDVLADKAAPTWGGGGKSKVAPDSGSKFKG